MKRHQIAAVAVAAIATFGGVGAAHVFAPAPPPATCHALYERPDPVCTPGAIDPRVTQANVGQTICHPGYTKTVRPPASLTDRIKLERMRAYGLKGKPSDYELDHLVSLELGGATQAVQNLWPEAYAGAHGAHQKDAVENRLHALICSGQLPLADAQREIAQDWIGAGQRHP